VTVPALSGQVVELDRARETRSICALLVIHAVVSFRSVPRILDLLRCGAGLGLNWTPHFTSVINWTLRLGLGVLRQVAPTDEPWLAIVDHSIDIGTKKALVVLRVSTKALSARGGAICLEDCACVGLTISEKINGETVATDLRTIFAQAGNPVAIVRDGDATLQKGVRLWRDEQIDAVPIIYDIGHAAANVLKEEFETKTTYQRFIALTSHAASRLRQTDLAFLIPPKLRSKGRFQSIGNLGQWAAKILEALSVEGGIQPPTRAKLREVLPGFMALRGFVQRFASTTHTVARMLEILKNNGLNHANYELCAQLLATFPKNSRVRKRLDSWLRHHLEIQKQLAANGHPDLPLMVSSDVIESLFGKYKHILERSPQADMNRSALLIPALCGSLDKVAIENALAQTRHDDLKTWEHENIPYTVRKKRRAFFENLNKIQSQIPGKLSGVSAG
jgi:hypothetical protein